MAVRWRRLGIAGVALGATLAAHAQLPDAETGARAPSAPAAPSPELARIAALGFDSLVADYYWLRAVQLVGGESVDPSTHAPAIGQLTEMVIALDPWVDHPYRFAALWMSERPDTIDAANRILERGIAYHPDDWRNRFYLSFNLFFYQGDVEGAARELEPAVGLEGAPRYLGRLLARLRSQNGGLDAAAAYLTELLSATEDGYHRAEYEKALDEIETERRARLLDQARAVYREHNGHDIVRVEELAQGAGAVLHQLPPEPHGWEWVLLPESGTIASSYYGRRYQLNFQAGDREKHEARSKARAASQAAGEAGPGAEPETGRGQP